jgi:hypothetical protein
MSDRAIVKTVCLDESLEFCCSLQVLFSAALLCHGAEALQVLEG